MSETHGNTSDPHGHGPAAPPEPKTPLWLTAVGGLLFLVVGLAWGLWPSTKDEAGTTTPTSASANADAGAPKK